MAAIAAQGQEPPSPDSATIFVSETDTLYTKVDSQPQYPGGKKAWQKYLVKTMRYPSEALDNEIMGETLVSFLVDVDGTVSDIKPVSGNPILSEESVRVIRSSGNWIPAIYHGQKVKAYHLQPIVYRLEFDRRSRKKKNQ